MCYGVPVIVTPEDGTFHPRIEDIERAVSSYDQGDHRQQPEQPVGRRCTPEQFIAEIVEFCERRGIWVLMDDIYHKLIFDGRRLVSPYKFTEQDVEASKIIVINGISKVYGMTGFRIGWAIAPRELVADHDERPGADDLVRVADPAGRRRGRAQRRAERRRGAAAADPEQPRRDRCRSCSRSPACACHKPDGTFYCLPDFRAYNNDSVKLSEFLLKKALVVTVPGKEFGMEGHLRLSYSGTMKDVTEGLARMKWALDPNSANEIYIGDRKLVRDWL